jgi:hypothetical protein
MTGTLWIEMLREDYGCGEVFMQRAHERGQRGNAARGGADYYEIFILISGLGCHDRLWFRMKSQPPQSTEARTSSAFSITGLAIPPFSSPSNSSRMTELFASASRARLSNVCAACCWLARRAR